MIFLIKKEKSAIINRKLLTVHSKKGRNQYLLKDKSQSLLKKGSADGKKSGNRLKNEV